MQSVAVNYFLRKQTVSNRFEGEFNSVRVWNLNPQPVFTHMYTHSLRRRRPLTLYFAVLQVQAQLQLDGVTHSHPHLHPHLAAHAPYLMFPPPPFGLPIASLADSASAAAAVAAAAKSNSKNSSIADLRLKARKHTEALGLWPHRAAPPLAWCP